MSCVPIRSNTILYCDRWSDTVAFYRSVLGLTVASERKWFIEFELHDRAFVSVADASRATIPAGNGEGITLSWQVDGLASLRDLLTERGAEPTPIQPRWGRNSFMVKDPSGNRLEFWTL
jgi:catechol 2,3-dioxygenase-like lactoylglutathione lyase family enzyme